ncbi:acyltransferase family protein [Massilia pseudoviolaceinigra]|uniref:acyltransferase family protein n=1 Tax=Massilia pseudoviolaceinigra TaxID=3057165 RepID=UPI00279690B1|nr:acyltransferase family protein [Massilia sp. CCM 9206]MDQ1923279.1 acyltransferase family protein [Massilia sp. CCM 9206]
MNSHPMPSIRFLKESQLGEDSWHSLLISLLRGLAAIQVAAAHLRSEFFPGLRTLENPALWYQGLAFLTGFAHQAVVVFFLISGWLVGGSLLNKLGQPQAIRLYAIDRITRLWTVLLPTFVLILATGIASGVIDPRAPDFSPGNDYSVAALAGNLVGLQTIVVPEFGGNFPLWSLSNETWYYVMFPLLLMCVAASSGVRRALAASALLLVGALLPVEMVLYFTIWLLGAAFSRVRVECGAPLRMMMLVVLAIASVVFRLKGSNDDMVFASYPQDLLLSVLFLLFLSSTVTPLPRAQKFVVPLHRVAVFFSNFSFTLYVVHVPVLGIIGYVGMTVFGCRQMGANSLADLGVYLAMLAVVLVSSYGFYLMFEARTYAVRRWVKNLLMGKETVAQKTAPAKQ